MANIVVVVVVIAAAVAAATATIATVLTANDWVYIFLNLNKVVF